MNKSAPCAAAARSSFQAVSPEYVTTLPSHSKRSEKHGFSPAECAAGKGVTAKPGSSRRTPAASSMFWTSNLRAMVEEPGNSASRKACRRWGKPAGPQMKNGRVRLLISCASSSRNGKPPKWSPCRWVNATPSMPFGSTPACFSATGVLAPQSIRNRVLLPATRKQGLNRPPLPKASPLPMKVPSMDGGPGLFRQTQPGAQSALRRILEQDVAAVAARHVAGDGPAQPGTAGFGVARGIEPEEGAEHVLALGRRDARAVVVDQNLDRLLVLDHRHPDMLAVAPRIGDQIAEAAPHGVGAQRQMAALRQRQQHRRARPAQGVGDVGDQDGQIAVARFLGALAAGEVDIALHHALHGGEVGFELGGFGVVLLQL